jgi:predicted RNase H-like HicB family nuclease
MKEFVVIYEQGPTSWGAMVPDLPICFAVGKTFEEVRERIHAAIEMHIEGLCEDGVPVPEPITRAESLQVVA